MDDPRSCRKIVRMAPIPLSCIRGADIGAAQRSLPPCDRDSPETMTAVDAVDVGHVRNTFRKTQQKRHRAVPSDRRQYTQPGRGYDAVSKFRFVR